MGRGSWLLAAGAAFGFTACLDGDHEARLNRPQGPLAVGAYHEVRFGDACSGGGKLNFCSTQRLTSIDAISSKDAAVARVVVAKDLPVPFGNEEYYLLGVAPGATTIMARGRFDDGSIREAEVEVEVRTADQAKLISPACQSGESDTVYVSPGGSGSFAIQLLAAGVELRGCRPRVLDPLPGVVTFCDNERTFFGWSAPAAGTDVDLRSPLVGGSVGRLKAYLPRDVGDVQIESLNRSPLVVSAEGAFPVTVKMFVDNVAPCESPPGVLQTLTPDVCSGPDGARVWPGDSRFGGEVVPHAEGVCTLRASADGQRFFEPVDFTLFMVTAPDKGTEYAGVGNPCKKEGATTCSYGLGATAICHQGYWRDQRICAARQVCEFRAMGAACTSGALCAECRDLR
jgi:hypothetical protein